MGSTPYRKTVRSGLQTHNGDARQEAGTWRACRLARHQPRRPAIDPYTNPKGVRCTLQDNQVNVWGRDPTTGYARRPFDNVGVQYGLNAFNSGVISAEKFLELNEYAGGYDINGKTVSTRTAADRETLRIAYQTGRGMQAVA